jgi:lipopolysaccharide export LptBFGC system permease protein LptF
MPAPISIGPSAPYLPSMSNDRQQAAAEFRRMIKWILAIAAAMVVLALVYLHLTSSLTLNMVIATVLGVFFSVLLGCGLFAASFFSDKSGHDQSIADSTRSERDKS